MQTLGIMFLCALVISALGFIMYVYFFSVGYGFSIAAIASALLILFQKTLTPGAVIECVLLILYGIRLGSYLVIRECKSTSYKNLLKGETKENVKMSVKVMIWISCAFLYTCMCAPVMFRMRESTSWDLFLIIGLILMAAGILMEIAADYQKSVSKKKNPGQFVSTGLYRIVRCPNYLGELFLWSGVFLAGIPAFHTVGSWIIAVVGYAGIIYVMFSGARRLEIRQDKNYGEDERYQEYVSRTPILIPFIPLYSVRKYTWLVA